MPQPASAHARLLQSDPTPGAVLSTAPPAVTLVFSEPVTPAGAGIRVYAPSGRQVAHATAARGAVLSAPVDAEGAGTYVVLWQVYAADTHPSRGAFAFVVGHTSANPFASLLEAPEAGTATPLGLALQAMARLIHFAGFALVFGVVAYRMLTGRKGPFGHLVGAGVALLIVAEPVALLGQLASLSFDADTTFAVLGSSFGRILGLRLGAALLAWTLIATERPWPVLGVGAATAVLDGLSAHGIPGVPFAGQLLVAMHGGAMGLWVGGITAFIGSPDKRKSSLSASGERAGVRGLRFGRYALATFGVAAITGLVLALVHTSFGAALLTTDYGRVLLLKVFVVGAAVVAALVRRRRLELVVAIAAVAFASLLGALPPPS